MQLGTFCKLAGLNCCLQTRIREQFATQNSGRQLLRKLAPVFDAVKACLTKKWLPSFKLTNMGHNDQSLRWIEGVKNASGHKEAIGLKASL